MKMYYADLFSNKGLANLESLSIATALGWTRTSSWTFNGEDGLTRRDIAVKDLAEVAEADVFILRTYPRGSKQSGGGRHVEFGYALALGKIMLVIGHYEHVFCHHPNVKLYPTIKDLIADWEVR